MSDNGDTFERGDQADPLPSLRALHRRGEVDSPRAVLLRVQWVRRGHPETVIATELGHLDELLVVVKATVTLPSGARATGHAAEQLGEAIDRSAALERAETRAVGRALDLLGYALVAEALPTAEDHPEATGTTQPLGPTRLDTPSAERADRPETPERPETTSGRWSTTPTTSTTPREVQPTEGDTRPPVVDALRRIRRPEQPDVPDQATPVEPPVEPERQGGRRPPIALRPRSSPGQSPRAPEAPASSPNAPDDTEEPPLEDYSWNAFWRWARQRGFASHQDLARAIGRPTQGMTPGQIRAALRDTGVEE